MGSLNKLIRDLQSEDVQESENLEAIEHVLRSAGMQGPRLQKALNQIKTGNSLAVPVSSFRSPLAAAIFDITITRNSANITRALPVPIFGALDRESQYVEVIGALDSGVTVTVASTSDKKGLRFTYVEGANTDTVDVNCTQIPYVNLLRASQGSLFKMSQNKMIISDSAQQTQFSQAISLFERSMFGKQSKDTLTPNQFKSDLQNQNDMRTIDAIIDIDMEKTFCPKIINVASFTTTFTSFIQKYEKSSSQGF